MSRRARSLRHLGVATLVAGTLAAATGPLARPGTASKPAPAPSKASPAMTLAAASVPTYSVTTVAGNGSGGETGDGGPATSASINGHSVVSDGMGGFYLGTSDGVVRHVDTTGTITTVPGLSGRFVAMANGYLYTDNGDGCAVDRYDPSTGTVATVASTPVSTGDPSPSTTASCSYRSIGLPLAVDGSGNVYFSDSPSSGGWIGKVDATTGATSVVAGQQGAIYPCNNPLTYPLPLTCGNLDQPRDLALDAAGNLYANVQAAETTVEVNAADTQMTAVFGGNAYGTPVDGQPAAGSPMSIPYGLAVEADGSYFVAGQNFVSYVDTSGIVHDIAGNGTNADSGDGGPASQAGFRDIEGLALGPGGVVYVVENYAVRELVPSYAVTVSVTGPGVVTGGPTASPTDISCSSSGGACSHGYPPLTLVDLTATPASPGEAVAWTGCYTATGDTCTVYTSQAEAVTATFTVPSYTLSVGTTGAGTGTVTTDSGGISCTSGGSGTCTASYPLASPATTVTASAAPAAGSFFAGWTGCPTNVGVAPCPVSMDADHTLTALFDTGAPLTVKTIGAGEVTSADGKIACGTTGSTCAAGYTVGATVTLTATPASGYQLQGWSGCDSTSGATCTIGVGSAAGALVEAVFWIPNAETLHVTVNGQGTVTASAGVIACPSGPCQDSFVQGTQVTLTATTASGYHFDGWGGACAPAGTAATCTLTLDASTSVDATFSMPSYPLTVDLTGTGSGTVTSSDGKVTCTTTCTTSLPSGTTFSLTATPAAGSTFTSWTGACLPSGNTCQGTLNAPVTVTVVFTQVPDVSLSVSLSGSGQGVVRSSTGAVNCGAGANVCTDHYAPGTSVTLTALAASGSTFAGWSNCPSPSGPTCTVSGLTADRTVGAAFGLSAPPPTAVTPPGAGSGAGAGSGGSGGTGTPQPSGPSQATLLTRSGVSQNLPASQSGYQPATKGGDPVDLVFGNFTHQHTDLSSQALMGVHLVRTYNSAEPSDGPLGHGWSISYTDHLADSGAQVAVTRGDGRLDVFTRNGDGTYQPAPGSQETLSKDASGYLLTTSGGDLWRFDPAGRLSSVGDADGNTVHVVYADGRWSGLLDAQGRSWTVGWAAGRIATVEDPTGRVVRYGYDAAGDLTSVTDPAGGTVTMAYDGAHRLTRIVDANGHLFVTNTYDPQGRVVGQLDARGTHRFTYLPGRTVYTDPTGATAQVAYDASYRIVRRTDAGGATQTLHYDPHGLVDEVTDADGGVTSYTFDGRGDTTSVTDPSGDTVHYTYDALGDRTSTSQDGRVVRFAYDARRHLVAVTGAAGTTHYAYDARGEVVEAVAPDGATTRYAYDKAGNRVSSTDPLGRVTRYGYDALGRRVLLVAPGGRVVRYAYDALGHLVASTSPTGATTRYAYDKAGNRTLEIDASGRRTRFVYDAANDLVAVVDPLGRTTRSTYDADGHLLSTTLPSGRQLRNAYDPAGRLVATYAPAGEKTTYAYDPAGRLLSTTDPSGAVTRYGYDAAGRKTSVTDALGHTTTYAYDGGLLASVTDALGHTTTYAYDGAGRRLAVTDPLGRSLRYRYDAAGRLVARVNGQGQVVRYRYDAAGRLVEKLDAKGITRYGYDAAGNRIWMRDATGVSRYRYDKAGRLLSASTPEGTLRYAYDRLGRRTLLVQPGLTTRYRYDAAGDLTAVLAGPATARYRYDADGRLATALYGNGVVARYGHDADGRLVQLTIRRAGRLLLGLRYTYDTRGALVAARSSGAERTSVRYGYDAAARLTSVSGTVAGHRVHQAFAYDPVGNRVAVGSQRLTYNAADELVAPGYRYDRAGQLVATPGRRLAYSADGQLVQAGGIRFAYDGLGDRVASGRTGLLVDTAASLPLRVAAGGVRFAYGVGAFAVIRGHQVTYLQDGLLGTPVLATSARGQLLAAPTPSAFGSTPPTASLGLSGAPVDAGLLYLRARTYDPSTGTFLTPDPQGQVVGDPTTTNPYAYAADSPTNLIDPTGQFSLGGFLGGIASGIANAAGAAFNALGAAGTAFANFAGQSGPDSSSTKGSGDASAGAGGFDLSLLANQLVVQTAGGQVIAAGGGNFAVQEANGVIAAGGGNLVVDAAGQVIAAGGGNVIAAGGGNLVFVDAAGHVIAAGGGNFTVGVMQADGVIAAGGGNLAIQANGVIAAGGGNLLGSQLGNSLFSGSGNGVVAAGGGNVIAAGGGNVIAAGGGNVIAAGGGN